MIFVTGRRTSIVRELEKLLPADEKIVPSVYGRPLDLERPDCSLFQMPIAQRYLFAAGVMVGKPIGDQAREAQYRTLSINCLNPIRMCQLILDRQADARICVIGSESAWRGSFDEVYAASKAALHAYVLARTLKPTQQLVCLSPPIISDAGMTLRRHDYPAVLQQRETVTSLQVAQRIHRLLYGPLDPMSSGIVYSPWREHAPQ